MLSSYMLAFCGLITLDYRFRLAELFVYSWLQSFVNHLFSESEVIEHIV